MQLCDESDIQSELSQLILLEMYGDICGEFLSVDQDVKGRSENLVLRFPGFSPTREPNVSLRSAGSWTW